MSVIYISITMEPLFKVPAISSTNSGNVPMLVAVVVAVVINVAEFGMACSRDAGTHFLGLVSPESPGQSH